MADGRRKFPIMLGRTEVGTAFVSPDGAMETRIHAGLPQDVTDKLFGPIDYGNFSIATKELITDDGS